MPKLTDRFLVALSVDKDRKDRLVLDTLSPGLGVRVTAKGNPDIHRTMDGPGHKTQGA
jgi:hypothetical protein